MDKPLISHMRQTSGFMRSTAATVLITFGMLILQPTIAAAQEVLVKPTIPAAQLTANPVTDNSAEAQLSKTLQKIEVKLARFEAKLQAQQQGMTERNELKQLKQTLKRLDKQVRKNFKNIEQHILDHQLDSVIMARHHAMVSNYQEQLAALMTELDGIETQADNSGKMRHAEKAMQQLKAKPNKRKQQPFDPKQLPFQASQKKARAPKESKEELEQMIRPTEPLKVASLALTPEMLAQATLPTIPVAADLQATEDVQITDEIKALALQLENNPVQGSQMTLDNQRGNAFDTASLLIALLRAANISARYAYGTVQVPIDKVMNWVGGVESPTAALELMLQGGIPTSGLAEGGVIKFAKFEHIWVEAWVDYQPSRGAINKTGDSWVPMDASFKQYEYTPGMDIKNNVPFDTQNLIDQATQSAIVNEQEGSITGIDQNQMQTLLDAYQTEVKTHIEQTKPNATVGDVIGNKDITVKEYPILASGLPYTLLQTIDSFAVIPDHLRHQISFKLFVSNSVSGSPAFNYQISLPKLSDQRVSFVYEPTTEADKAVLDTAFENYQIKFAAYLVAMTPALKIEGQPVAVGGSYTVGTDQLLTVEITTPWYTQPRNYQVTSGDTWTIGVNSAGITAQMFDKRIKSHDLSNGNHPDFIEEMFNQIMLGYWGELNGFKEVMASTEAIRYYQLPSHGLAGAPVDITYNFGVPRWATYKSRFLDVKENRMSVIHSQNKVNKTINYTLKTGMLASYLESGIYDQAFLMEPGFSMSAVTALKKANEQSIPIYQINESNLATVLPKLTVDAAIKGDINNAVNAGFEVMVSRDPVTTANFTGAGYIITDPQTGSGSYRISGGRDGNNSGAPQSVYPLPQIPATPIFSLLVGSTFRTAGVGLATESGVVMGVVIPEAGAAGAAGGSAGGPILAALMIALIIASTQSKAIEERYPKTSRILRHFTRAHIAPLIESSKLIFGSKAGGTFNPDFRAVYMAPAESPQAAQASCPPNAHQSVQISFDYELPLDKGEIREKRARGLVDVEITRAGYWDAVILPESGTVNSQGTQEVVFQIPFLYFGPFAVAIREHQVCY